jgi:hypothetical protein
MNTDKKKKRSPRYYLILASISMLVGVIVISGLVMKNDVTGRIIIGAVWFLVGAGWLGRFFHTRKIPSSTGRSA